MNMQSRHTPAWIKIGLLGLLLCTGIDVRAAPAACEVVGVMDGDTVTVRCGQAPEQNIRLAGITAPSPQALFWARARRNLSELLLRKQVQVDVVDTGSAGEPVAQVYLGSLHINARVVSDGMARCQNATTADDWCSQQEAQARSGLRGVWSDPWSVAGTPASPLAIKRRLST